MSYRFMRVLVFFDLPTATPQDKRAYRVFRKTLVKSGFIMLQESVYCRMLITPNAEKAVIAQIKANKPPSGIVQVLTVTEKQFANMEYLVGNFKSEVVDSDKRMIVL